MKTFRNLIPLQNLTGYKPVWDTVWMYKLCRIICIFYFCNSFDDFTIIHEWIHAIQKMNPCICIIKNVSRSIRFFLPPGLTECYGVQLVYRFPPELRFEEWNCSRMVPRHHLPEVRSRFDMSWDKQAECVANA